MKRQGYNYSDTIIIGAGASGLFCAWLLKRAGKQFLILERADNTGRKLSISGGGHANFTNCDLSPANYFSETFPAFGKLALEIFNGSKIRHLIKTLGLNFYEKEKGKIFLKEEAKKLTQKLLEPSRSHLRINSPASKIIKEGQIYKIVCPEKIYTCRNIVLAPGSPARPQLANCPNCWQIVRDLDLPVTEPRPALAPLLFPDNQYADFKNLSGLSTLARVGICGGYASQCFEDKLLFTHFGLSGPATLNISLYFRQNSRLIIDFLPEKSFSELCDSNGAKTPLQLLRGHLPTRLADTLLPEKLAHEKCAELSRANRLLLHQSVHEKIFENMRPAGLARAEVCAGGLSTAVLNPATMQIKTWPGLYAAGELLDYTGQLGGYNLHWAFASAFCAASSICNAPVTF